MVLLVRTRNSQLTRTSLVLWGCDGLEAAGGRAFTQLSDSSLQPGLSRGQTVVVPILPIHLPVGGVS